MDDLLISALAAASLFIGVLFGASYGVDRIDAFKIDAIERGYAQHCPKDGRWAWVDTCDTQQ